MSTLAAAGTLLPNRMPVSHPYVLGDSESELQRLMDQSRFIGDLTEQSLRQAGIEWGMSVLDCGCGAGDVSFLVSRLVGPGGRVIGVDRSMTCVELARRRASEAGLQNMTFEAVEVTNFAPSQPIDALVGRFILMYLSDPAAALRKLADCVRPGGLIVFQEVAMSLSHSEPVCHLTTECRRWIHETFRRAGVDIDMGLKLFSIFKKAGLPSPEMILSSGVEGGPDSPVYRYLAHILNSLLPAMERYGVASASEVAVESFAERLREEVVAAGSILVTPCLVAAWTRIGNQRESDERCESC
jgi:ubiquinone/menaquinone biosynthesis C-methylase UbiE